MFFIFPVINLLLEINIKKNISQDIVNAMEKRENVNKLSPI